MGAPAYDARRVALIKKLAGTMLVAEMAKTIGTSRDALRVWLGRHAKAHGIAHTTKVYRRREPSPPQQAQPGA
jgi:hypothetical protein